MMHRPHPDLPPEPDHGDQLRALQARQAAVETRMGQLELELEVLTRRLNGEPTPPPKKERPRFGRP